MKDLQPPTRTRDDQLETPILKAGEYLIAFDSSATFEGDSTCNTCIIVFDAFYFFAHDKNT
jgi:hypothetical protein